MASGNQAQATQAANSKDSENKDTYRFKVVDKDEYEEYTMHVRSESDTGVLACRSHHPLKAYKKVVRVGREALGRPNLEVIIPRFALKGY